MSMRRISNSARKRFRARRGSNSEAEAVSKVTPGLPNGIIRPVKVSFPLSNFLGGVPQVTRTHAALKIWDHIKQNNLQNLKGDIRCDEKLKVLFDGRDRVGYLEISRLLTPHFVRTN